MKCPICANPRNDYDVIIGVHHIDVYHKLLEKIHSRIKEIEDADKNDKLWYYDMSYGQFVTELKVLKSLLDLPEGSKQEKDKENLKS
jgi:hypothetical protein